MVENRIKNLSLNGFLVFSEMNSEGIYLANYDLSHLNSKEIQDLRHKLEELYYRIDSEYAKGEARMRSFKIKWVSKYDRFAVKKKKVEVPVLSFYIMPNRIINWLKQARKVYYDLLWKHTIKIPMSSNPSHSIFDEEGEHSHYIVEKSLYLLPTERVSIFTKDFEKIENIYRGVFENVRDFAYSDYFTKLNDILREYNLRPLSQREIINREPIARFNMMVIEMDEGAVRRWMEEDPKVARRIREATAEFVVRAVKGLQGEVKPILENIKKNLEDWVKGNKRGSRQKIVEDIEVVQGKMDALGMGRLQELDAIKNLLTGEVQITEDDAHLVYNLADDVDGRLQSFLIKDRESESKKKAEIKKALKHIDEEGIDEVSIEF